MGIVLSAISNC